MEQAGQLERSGHFAEAASAYRTILQSEPNNFPARFGLGKSSYHLHLYSDAVQNFQLAWKSAPQDFAVQAWLARSYIQNMECQKALDLLHDGRNEADAPLTHLLLARAYDSEDKLDDARSELHRALQLDPQCRGAHFALGYIDWTLRDLKAAEQEFSAELALRAHEYLAYYYLAETLAIDGQLDEAGNILTKMANENANTYDYHLAAGKWNERKRNLNTAAEEFRAAILIDPRQPEAHYHLAVVLRKLGQTEAANTEFDRSNRLHEMTSGIGQGMGRMRPHLPDFDLPMPPPLLARK